MCSGGARVAIDEAVKYALQRRQFGKPIAAFGAVAQKLGEMSVRQYALESMLYRTAGLIQGALQVDHSPARVVAVLEEYAIESSIVKVAGSEAADFIFDQNVQIHGGNGFVRDYPAERRYRDARVNRIFEGTNEINRLLIPTLAVRRAAKGALPLFEASAVAGAIPHSNGGETDRATIGAMKETARLVLSRAVERYGERLGDRQEVLTAAADIMIEVYASESAMLRASAAGSDLHASAARAYVADAAARAQHSARTAFCAMDAAAIPALDRLMPIPSVDVVALRRTVADAAIDRRGYPF